MAFNFVRESGIRKLARAHGKRVGKDFLNALDVHINDVVEKSCRQFNGHKRTLDATIGSLIIRGMK